MKKTTKKMAMGGFAKGAAPVKKAAPAPVQKKAPVKAATAPIKQLIAGNDMAPPNAPKGPSKLGSKFNKGGMANKKC